MQETRINFLIDNFDALGESNHPERQLWLCVVLQQLLDMTKPPLASDSEEIVDNRQRAYNWFFTTVGVTAQDFEEVCDNAGIDAEYTRQYARRIMNNDVEFVRKKINTLLSH